jgi:uncharacterized tellurite resistance protein B-like protein
MLQTIRQLFLRRVAPAPPPRSADELEHALHLAAAVLLFEVVRADADVTDEERTVMRAGIQSTFDISGPEAEELMQLGERESRSATSIFPFTSLIDRAFSPVQKKRIVELLWLVTFADTGKDAEEEYAVRKIAGLLHVPHPDFIDAKIRARAATGSHASR